MELPTQLAAASVVLSDPSGQVLLVLTHHRTDLVLPGGLVEAGESPAAAAEREVWEEVGLQVEVTSLLVEGHASTTDSSPVGLYFVFDSPPLTARPTLVLQPEEIAEAHWLAPSDAVASHVPRGRGLLDVALSVRARAGGTAFIDDRLILPRLPT